MLSSKFKQVSHFVCVATLVSLLVACSSRSVNTELTRCVYPDSPRTPAPSFICDPSIDGYPITQLRQSPSSDVSVDERIEQVYTDQVLAWSSEWSKQWYFESQLQSQAQAWLNTYIAREARVIRSRISPTGELWLLIGLPQNKLTVKTLVTQALNP